MNSSSSSFLLLSIGLVILIVQQHEANAAPMDKVAGNELKSTMGMAASLIKAFHQGNGKENDSSDKCQKCKTEVKTFDEALVRNGANITKFLVDYTGSCGTDDKETCLKKLTQVTDELHGVFKDNEQCCKAAGACSANGASKDNLPNILFHFASLSQKIMKLKFGDDSSEKCEKCKSEVKYFDDELAKNEEYILQFFVDYGCPASDDEQTCLDIVEAMPALFQAWHILFSDNEWFCQKEGACPANGAPRANLPTFSFNSAGLAQKFMKLKFGKH